MIGKDITQLSFYEIGKLRAFVNTVTPKMHNEIMSAGKTAEEIVSTLRKRYFGMSEEWFYAVYIYAQFEMANA